MEIEISSIPACPNCKHLMMLLDRRGVQYTKKVYDPMNDDDVAEMCERGIFTAQFPVVWVDGKRLPAMSLNEYAEALGLKGDE